MKLKRLNASGFSHEFIIMVLVLLFAVTGVGYLVSSRSVNAGAAGKTATRKSPPPVVHLTTALPNFTVWDNTDYRDNGWPNATWSNTTKMNYLPAKFCDPLIQNGLPTQSAWNSFVNTYDPGGATSTGLLTIDCENIPLNNVSTCQAIAGEMQTLQSWTRQIRPYETLGWFNVERSTIPACQAYEAQLMNADPNTAFLPAMYTDNTDIPKWEAGFSGQMSKLVSTAPTIANRPVDVYLWPQQDNAKGHPFLAGTQWQWELKTAGSAGMNGIVMWGGWKWSGNLPSSGTTDWMGNTQTFLSALPAL